VTAMEEVAIDTPDGHVLPATLFESNAGLPGDGPTILISSATAAPRRFYRHFAQYLADNGARAAMTYEYRGMDGKLSRSEARATRMSDWATIDFPAAARSLKKRYPDHPLVGIGHSFGGQAFGLSGTADMFTRYMTLAAGSGYAGFTEEPRRNLFRLNWIGWPVAAILGHLPKWAGWGEPLPYGAFNQWRKWCNSPHYFMDDRSLPEIRRFADVMIPMMAVGFEDDPLATRVGIEALVSWYSRADIRLRWFTVEEAGGPVGHLGFFRPDHKGILWPHMADWLIRRDD
jgi:predicted alpha/beta hydrolase